MSNISPLGALLALVIIGITVEAVESVNKSAAYALVVLLLLGIITFNATAFSRQFALLVGVTNQVRKPPVKAATSPK